MKIIPLTQGQVALVDDADFDFLNQWKWFAHKARTGPYYACRNRKKSEAPGPFVVRMHRILLGVKKESEVDHEDGNGLNNQRNNLRPATGAQNKQAFQRTRKNKASKFRGVVWHRRDRKFQAQVKNLGRTFYLGYFVSEEAAARAYDTAARRLFGEFAQLNFPEKQNL
jgi:hypothetical protein